MQNNPFALDILYYPGVSRVIARQKKKKTQIRELQYIAYSESIWANFRIGGAWYCIVTSRYMF